ncbi:MAG: hypothetical protein K6L76_05435 [Agarilytica sp.]
MSIKKVMAGLALTATASFSFADTPLCNVLSVAYMPEGRNTVEASGTMQNPFGNEHDEQVVTFEFKFGVFGQWQNGGFAQQWDFDETDYLLGYGTFGVGPTAPSLSPGFHTMHIRLYSEDSVYRDCGYAYFQVPF